MTNQLDALIAGIKEQLPDAKSAWEESNQSTTTVGWIYCSNPVAIEALIAALEQSQRAKRTLESLGYTDNGGQFWKPPIGAKPNFSLIDSCRQRIAELEGSHKKLRGCLAGIHNTIKRDGAYTSLAVILSAAKRAHEESATIASVEARQLAVKLPESLVAYGDSLLISDVIEAIRAAGITVQGDE